MSKTKQRYACRKCGTEVDHFEIRDGCPCCGSREFTPKCGIIKGRNLKRHFTREDYPDGQE